MKKLLSLLLIPLLALALAACGEKMTLPESALKQLSQPSVGDMIAVFKTSEGSFTVRLFPEYAKSTVENFVALVSDGYYNKTLIHRVVSGLLIQGGDPTRTGTGGKSFSGEPLQNEFSSELHNFFGALGMASDGSQFYLVTARDVSAEVRSELLDAGVASAVAYTYESFGGAPQLDFRYTVFGQVIDGFETLLAIALLETDELSRPKTNVEVISVTITLHE